MAAGNGNRVCEVVPADGAGELTGGIWPASRTHVPEKIKRKGMLYPCTCELRSTLSHVHPSLCTTAGQVMI